MDQTWLPAPMWAEAFWQLTTWYYCTAAAQMVLMQSSGWQMVLLRVSN